MGDPACNRVVQTTPGCVLKVARCCMRRLSQRCSRKASSGCLLTTGQALLKALSDCKLSTMPGNLLTDGQAARSQPPLQPLNTARLRSTAPQRHKVAARAIALLQTLLFQARPRGPSTHMLGDPPVTTSRRKVIHTPGHPSETTGRSSSAKPRKQKDAHEAAQHTQNNDTAGRAASGTSRQHSYVLAISR